MNILIRQRENGKWQAIISYKDKKGKWKQKPKGGFDKRKDANLWAKEMSFELQRLEKKGILDNDYTLKEVYEYYVVFKKETFAKNTASLYKRAFTFFESFGNYNIKDLKSIDLLNYLDCKRDESGKTYNDYIRKMKSVVNFGMRELKCCDINPFYNLPFKKGAECKKIKFIDDKLYHEILKGILPEKQKLLIRTAYETGMRASEIFGIKTSNVKNCTIEVEEQYSPEFKELSGLKTRNSYRIVPISKELYQDLMKSTCDMNGRIFHDFVYDTVAEKLRRYNVSMHSFRHTRATILVSSGIDLTLVSSIIGDNIETILKTYVKKNTNDLNEKFEQVRALV